ncbi:MAG TPA: glycogen/starch/alpha-glucan phosphorylase [Candidatus Binatia bacterium]|nr:glycogen/starch/alpha-glucan phosphorylase [Candidatus Binatia bacterium]
MAGDESRSGYGSIADQSRWIPVLKASIERHLTDSLAQDRFTATELGRYNSFALAVRDQLIRRWLHTQRTYDNADPKRVYYLSLEFLLGRMLGNNLINLQRFDESAQALRELGYRLEDLREVEWDAGLGNGGLGRLAACFLDSFATLQLPAYGYGIRYEYGIFFQHIRDGFQVETPDNWLRYGNIWEIPRPEKIYLVQFYGRVVQSENGHGPRTEWVDTDNVIAMAYDFPIPGYGNATANNLRLWSAKSTREFDLDYFNHGDYLRAVEDRDKTETISKILYPNDNVSAGKELRLRQEYFFVSATLQDIVARYLKSHQTFDAFPDKVAIQLNDTHPALAIPELMRLLLDQHYLSWEQAWDITTRTFAYTNHTVLPEALEQWPVTLIEKVLPRILLIVYEINRRLMETVEQRFPGDSERLGRMSLFEESAEKKLRMAHLAIVGSHSINGVSSLHTGILTNELFRDFSEFYPGRFNNKTNGITQRRWLLLCNPRLAQLISRRLGDGWITDLKLLRDLAPLAEDAGFRAEWRHAKRENKLDLAALILQKTKIVVRPDSIFDCQIKRIHEYKRQLLNVLHLIYLYNRIKDGKEIFPRTALFAGKAAPGYDMAKLIIRLITGVAERINNDEEAAALLKVVLIPNYGVSLAEKIIPAADLSEQISTAGTEASGTSNMKFALNGALIIGTLDGANVEIREEVGADNIFILGLTADEVRAAKDTGYRPRHYYDNNPELRRIIEMIAGDYFSGNKTGLFKPIVESLLDRGDPYMVLADFEAYIDCQTRAASTYVDAESWTRKCILNVANMGKFSSDRTIEQYAREIWAAEPVAVKPLTENDNGSFSSD